MKKLILVLAIVTYTISIFAQIGTNIPQERLPYDSLGVLEWTKAGCLKDIISNGGMEIDICINVTTDLEDPVYGDTITEKINNIVANSTTFFSGKSLLFYFPPGEYNFTETIEINRNNVVLKGSGAGETTKNRIKNMGVSG